MGFRGWGGVGEEDSSLIFQPPVHFFFSEYGDFGKKTFSQGVASSFLHLGLDVAKDGSRQEPFVGLLMVRMGG